MVLPGPQKAPFWVYFHILGKPWPAYSVWFPHNGFNRHITHLSEVLYGRQKSLEGEFPQGGLPISPGSLAYDEQCLAHQRGVLLVGMWKVPLHLRPKHHKAH